MGFGRVNFLVEYKYKLFFFMLIVGFFEIEIIDCIVEESFVFKI